MKMVGGRLFSRCRGDWFYSVYLHPLNSYWWDNNYDYDHNMNADKIWKDEDIGKKTEMVSSVCATWWCMAVMCTYKHKQTRNKQETKMVSSIRDDARELYVPSQLRTPTPLPSTQPTPLPPIVMMRRIKMWRGGHFWLQDTGQVTNRPGVGVVG